MKGKADTSNSLLYSQITSTVSVALVLLMLGLIASGGFAVRNTSRLMAQEVGFSVVMTDSADIDAIRSVGRILASAPSTRSVKFLSPDNVMERWKSLSGGDDAAFLDENPFAPEWDVRVRDAYASSDSLAALAARLGKLPGVEEVSYQAEMTEAIVDGIEVATWIFIAIAAILALISFVLISNTIRLAVYSRRLTIHAMQLVGATRGFIRRPFLMSGFLAAIIAASCAAVVILGAYFYMTTIYPPIIDTLSWLDMLCVVGGLYLAGIIICIAASLLATNRYLRMNYDEIV